MLAAAVTPKHIKFIEGPPKPKTKTFWVVNKYDDFPLGSIGWFAKWRKYAFFPDVETVFEQDCLRDIAAFCEELTTEHRRKPMLAGR